MWIGVRSVALGLVMVAAGDWFGDGAEKAPFTVSKETTGIVSPLRGDGRVDYVAALNERYGKGVKKEENAFVGWLEVNGTGWRVLPEKTGEKIVELSGAGESEGIEWVTYDTYLKRKGAADAGRDNRLGEDVAAAEKLWTAEDNPDLAGYLKQSGPWLDGVRAAFGRKRYWLPAVSADGSLLNVLLPSLGRMRAAGNLLCARATLRAKAGDFEGFLADAMGAKKMARHLCSEMTVIERLVGVALDGMANRAIGAAAGRGIFTAKQYEALKKALEEAGPLPGMLEAVDVCERWNLLDAVAEVAMKGDARMSNGDLYAGGGVERESVDWDVVLRMVNGEVDAEVAAMKKSTLEEVEAEMKPLEKGWKEWVDADMANLQRKEGETREAYTQRVARGLLVKLIPNLARTEMTWREAVMQDEMLEVVVAAGRFRVEQGDWAHSAGGVDAGVCEGDAAGYSCGGEDGGVSVERGRGDGDFGGEESWRGGGEVAARDCGGSEIGNRK